MTDNKSEPIKIRVIKDDEIKYVYMQSHQINMQTGRIGYLRGDFGSNGDQFYTSWFDEIPSRKTPEFKDEFDYVVNELRDNPKFRGILRNFEDMKLLCATRPQSKCETERYCFRADTKNHSYLISCKPIKGDYNFYIVAYQKTLFNRHIKAASKGIRFVTPDYNPLFTIHDNEEIKITSENGETHKRICRYIDEYHFELIKGVGENKINCFHICEFAELMQKNNSKVIPMRSSLPSDCLAYIENENKIVRIIKGEAGYCDTEFTVDDADKNKETVNMLNAANKVTPQQLEAMKVGALSGWESPKANPENYDNSGIFMKREIKSVIAER